MNRNSVLLLISFVVICIIQIDSDTEGQPKLSFVVLTKLILAHARLKNHLKKNDITCDTYRAYCSKVIEGSPHLKQQSEKIKSHCEKNLKKQVCQRRLVTGVKNFIKKGFFRQESEQ